MATLRREGNELVVKLSSLEKLGALRDDIRVPWASVRYVRVNESPFRELRGVRVGTRLPGVIALGTWYMRGGKLFAAIYRRSPGVVVELDGARYRKLVVTLPDASEVAASLSRDLGL
jgi:hypothetical protein